MRESGTPTDDVPALRKGLAVLESLAHDGAATLTELQQRSGLNRTMTFRIARTLRERGYVRYDPISRRYALSLRLFELGRAAALQLDVVAVAQPHLDDLRLEFGETANLGVLEDGHAVYVAMAEAAGAVCACLPTSAAGTICIPPRSAKRSSPSFRAPPAKSCSPCFPGRG